MEIRQTFSQEAINNVIEKREPIGLFLFEEKPDIWVAVDNSTGDAWTEAFKTKQEAIDWLEGKIEKV